MFGNAHVPDLRTVAAVEVSEHIRREARAARETAGRTLLDVAIEAGGLQPSTIQRFENRVRGWAPMTDRIVEAYERACGLPDGELWRRAIH